MAQDTSGKCPTCGDKKHVVTDTGLARCPECFIPSRVARVLKRHGLPTKWSKLTLDTLASALPAEDLIVPRLKDVISGSRSSIHFFGEPSISKQLTFAFTVSALIARYGDVTIYDSEELARNHFNNEKRGHFTHAKGPVVLTLGKENETKLGSLYFRSIVEHCSQRNLPIVLFTDGSPDSMSGRYHDFMSLYKMARFISFSVPEVHSEV